MSAAVLTVALFASAAAARAQSPSPEPTVTWPQCADTMSINEAVVDVFQRRGDDSRLLAYYQAVGTSGEACSSQTTNLNARYFTARTAALAWSHAADLASRMHRYEDARRAAAAGNTLFATLLQLQTQLPTMRQGDEEAIKANMLVNEDLLAKLSHLPKR